MCNESGDQINSKFGSYIYQKPEFKSTLFNILHQNLIFISTFAVKIYFPINMPPSFGKFDTIGAFVTKITVSTLNLPLTNALFFDKLHVLQVYKILNVTHLHPCFQMLQLDT